MDDKALKRAALDYGPLAHVTVHQNWRSFLPVRGAGRLVLFTTRAEHLFPDFAFRANDILLMGSESAGVPKTSTPPPTPACASHSSPARGL